MAEEQARVMAFRRHGRSYHLIIETSADLELALKLDEALWVSTGAPIESLINADPVLLELVDSDHNGRILCGEMKDAIRWTLALFKDRSGIDSRSATLKMSALDTDHEDGKRIVESHQSARRILNGAEAPGEDEVTLDQVRAMKSKVEATPISELGVVLPEAAKDPAVRQFILDILSTLGGVPHPTGKPGVDKAQLDRFLAAVAAYLAWAGKDNIPAGQKATEIMPLGAATPAAFAALSALRAKLDTFFVQCRGVALDPKMAERMGPREADLDRLNLEDAAVVEQLLKDSPVARPNAAGSLDFEGPLNPCYAAALAELRKSVVEPALGYCGIPTRRDAPPAGMPVPQARLSEADWEKVKAVFAAHAAWVAAKPPEPLDSLGEARLAACLDPALKSAMENLIAEGAKTAFVLGNIRLTEKAVLYQANLLLVANNFISFPDLYEEKRSALFENGALVMDGRRFNLAIKVTNRSAHAEIAKTGSMFVVYVELTNRHDGRKMEVVMPVVAGGRGNLNVGKRGLFVDFAGEEWDAQVVHIIENPISLIEAVLSPFTRLGKMVTGKIESASTNAEQKLQSKALSVADHPASAAPAPAAAAAPAGGGAMTMVMGGSVALAALGAGAAYITTALAGVPWWEILIGLVAAILVLLSPLMILAILKLRKRDLSAILEGSGWAINARMRLTRRQAKLFTRKPPYPRDAEGIRGWGWWIASGIAAVVLIAGIAVGWYYLSTHPLRRALPWSASEVEARWSKVYPAYSYYLTARMSRGDFDDYCRRLKLTPVVPGATDFDNDVVAPNWSAAPSADNTFVGQDAHVTTRAKYANGAIYVKTVAR